MSFEILGVGSDSEKKEVDLPEVELEGNVKLPGVDTEGQDAPQVFEMDDPNIPTDPH